MRRWTWAFIHGVIKVGYQVFTHKLLEIITARSENEPHSVGAWWVFIEQKKTTIPWSTILGSLHLDNAQSTLCHGPTATTT